MTARIDNVTRYECYAAALKRLTDEERKYIYRAMKLIKDHAMKTTGEIIHNYTALELLSSLGIFLSDHWIERQ